MSMFFYSNKKTFFHSLDPRIKIISLILFFVDVLIIKDITGMLIITGLIFVFFILSDSVLNLKKILPLFFLIGIITFILWVIFFKGENAKEKIYILKKFYIYKEAIKNAIFLTLRLLNFLFIGLLFLSITSYEDFSYGLMLLGLPYPVAFTFLLSFKLVDSFINTAFQIVEAQKARGNDITKGNIFKRIKSYAPLVIPLILNGIKKAHNLILALETRGFSPKNKIDIKGKYRIKIKDILFVLIMIIFLFFLLNYYNIINEEY